MQQRRLRLGDILDDYCPRERRITNHAVVAMIEDTVKQTRCTTCDADHEYKHAKVPAARRRKTGALAAQLVEGSSRLPVDGDYAPDEAPVAEDLPVITDSPFPEESTDVAAAPDIAAAPDPAVPEETEAAPVDEGDADRDEWPVHRPLIRATLPRPEGQTPERKAPDFTFRPAGGKFDNRNSQRHRGHRPARQAQGQSSSGQGQRFGGQRPAGQGRGPGHGGPHGQRQGNRPGQGGGTGRPGPGRGPRPGGGRKRGR